MINSGLLNKKIALVFAVSQTFLNIPALAAGFQLNETSTSLQGSAMAGSAAAINDVSALFNNPATLATLSQTQGYLGANAIMPRINMSDGYANHLFNVPGTPASAVVAPVNGMPYQNNVYHSSFIPNGYLGWHLGDKVVAGISFVEPFYLSTYYSKASVLRFSAVESKIRTVNINPTIAYQVNEKWSVGAGWQAQYLRASFSNFNGPYTGIEAIDQLIAADYPSYVRHSGWGNGFTLGALYQPNKLTRIGLGYRSQVVTHLHGDGLQYTFAGEIVPAPSSSFPYNKIIGAETTISTPNILTLSAARDIQDWTVKGTVQVNFWNALKHINLQTANAYLSNNAMPMRWNTAWFAALGADYRVNPSWILRGGIAYDQTPTTHHFRNPRIPAADRLWLNLGLSFSLSDHVSFDGAYGHAFIDNQRINLNEANISNGENLVEANQVSAKYKGLVNVISLALRYSA